MDGGNRKWWGNIEACLVSHMYRSNFANGPLKVAQESEIGVERKLSFIV